MPAKSKLPGPQYGRPDFDGVTSRLIAARATAPALVFVATYFVRNLAEIDWSDVTEYAPATLAAILMPLTYSITNGIAVGFIVYALCKIFAGRWREATPMVLAIAILSVVHFAIAERGT
mgnify:CR=1 FL=1